MKIFITILLTAMADAASKSSKSSSLSYSFGNVGDKGGKSNRLLINVDEIDRMLHEADDGMSYRVFVPSAKASKLSSSKSAKSKVDLFSKEQSAKAGKSSDPENIFGRFLVIEEYSMSYPDVIVPGKSIKLKPKSSKKSDKNDIAVNTSSKAGKSTDAKIAPRSIDPSSTSTLNAVDFTKAMPEALVDDNESSDAATIIYGLTTSCVLLTSYLAF